VNLLTLRPEVCTVLLIHDENWFKLHSEHPDEEMRFHFCDEFARILDESENEREAMGDDNEAVRPVKFAMNDSGIVAASPFPLSAERMVPPGAAALWLGVDVMRKVLERREQQPPGHPV
jgi:hypothetical protein